VCIRRRSLVATLQQLKRRARVETNEFARATPQQPTTLDINIFVVQKFSSLHNGLAEIRFDSYSK
jgi:hypothetical protein